MSESTVIDILDKDTANGFRTISNEDINSVVTFAEVIADSGFNEEEIVYISSPYTVLKGDEKATLNGVPFYLRSWRFAIDQDTERPYVVAHAVTEKNELIILTDGSTGIFAQLSELTRKRIGAGHATPYENALVANGLRFSEYGVTAEGKPAKKGEKVESKARTYYLA